MVQISGRISDENRCVWDNFIAYYSKGFIVLSAINNKGFTYYEVLARSKRDFELAMKDSNR